MILLLALLLLATSANAQDYSTDTVPHDVLILYTQAALTKHGQTGIDRLVVRCINDANAAYRASGVRITLRLVDTGLSPVTEQIGGVLKTLTAFRLSAASINRRNSVKADFAVLLTVDSGSYAGAARLSSNEAFAVVKTGAIGGKTFTHEIGHLQGLAHNRENPSSAPVYPYGYGYRLCVEPQAFRDIMSFPCGGGVSAPRINQFGNPLISYNGYPTGTATSNPAKALNDNALAVARYR
jgi:hypothetical protein